MHVAYRAFHLLHVHACHIQSRASPVQVTRKARSRMTDTTVVEWAGEPVKTQGKKTFYDKALINKKEVSALASRGPVL